MIHLWTGKADRRLHRFDGFENLQQNQRSQVDEQGQCYFVIITLTLRLCDFATSFLDFTQSRKGAKTQSTSASFQTTKCGGKIRWHPRDIVHQNDRALCRVTYERRAGSLP